MRAVLYPLVGILSLSYKMFSLVHSQSEIAILFSGLLVSGLIGVVYLGLPFAIVRLAFPRLRNRATRRSFVKPLGAILLAAIGLLMLGDLVDSVSLLMVASVAVVLASLSLSAALTSTGMSSCFNAIKGTVMAFRTKTSYSGTLVDTGGSGVAAFHENTSR